MNEHIDLTHIEYLAEDTDLESQLKTALVETRKQVERQKLLIEALQEDVQKRDDVISNVTRIVQREYDCGKLEDEEVLLEDLCLYLDIERTETTEVTITTVWRVNVTHKRGYDLQDLSVDVADPEIDGDDIELGYIRHHETEIDVY